MRSGGIGVPVTMYLKTRACCSSSCHWDGVKGDLFLALAVAVALIIVWQKEEGRVCLFVWIVVRWSEEEEEEDIGFERMKWRGINFV